MSIKGKVSKEQLPAPPNLPPGDGYWSRWRFILRKWADLQVASVLLYLKPWLSGLSGEVLEVGCGAQPYRFLLPKDCHYQGIDWQGAKQYFQYSTPDTVYYDGGFFPFADHSFDYLFHTEVLEHVYDYNSFLQECHRILRPGGTMLFTIPFQARYHYIPFDFWRFTPAALERLLVSSGFDSISVQPRGNDLVVAAYKVVSIIYRWLQGNIIGKILGVVFSFLLIIAIPAGHLAMKLELGSSDDCLGYVVIAQRNN